MPKCKLVPWPGRLLYKILQNVYGKWGGDCRKGFQKNYFAEQTSIESTRLAVSVHATEAKLLQSGDANAELSIAYFPKMFHNYPKN